jgi:hypothetical protein
MNEAYFTSSMIPKVERGREYYSPIPDFGETKALKRLSDFS